MWDTIKGVAIGVLEGITVAALGYAKNNKQESFDNKKFFKTVLLGAFIGGGAALSGVTYDEFQDYAETTGLLVLIEYASKAVWRNILEPYLKKMHIIN